MNPTYLPLVHQTTPSGQTSYAARTNENPTSALSTVSLMDHHNHHHPRTRRTSNEDALTHQTPHHRHNHPKPHAPFHHPTSHSLPIPPIPPPPPSPQLLHKHPKPSIISPPQILHLSLVDIMHVLQQITESADLPLSTVAPVVVVVGVVEVVEEIVVV